MALKFCSFASGSSGNCYLVKSEETAVLIDVGITGKQILEKLGDKGIAPENVDAILLTHEHVDHIRSLKMMAKKAQKAKVYGSKGTLARVGDKVSPVQAETISRGKAFKVGDIEIRPFGLCHDAAEPMGYGLRLQDRQVTIVTDTGCISDEIFAEIQNADLLVLEANHEVNILKMGTYPYHLKRRILGEQGHLSNEDAGRCLCQMLKSRSGQKKAPRVVLAHLSKENNSPGQAYLTIRNILNEEDFYIEKDLDMEVAAREQASEYMEV